MERSHQKQIALWLFCCCFMVAGMVVIGGLTRLTGSGLSMVNWSPILGWFPPLNQEEWLSVFHHYQQSPEFMHVNSDMDVEGFKGIFWLEFIHRLFGRTIGLIFLFPFLYFLWRKQLESSLKPKLIMMFVLGGLQGGMGWYMVKSGLVDDPRVSQYRLTAHLGLAILIYAYMMWVGLGLYFNKKPHPSTPASPRLATLSTWLTGLILLTLLSGGFVAGLDAGLTYNTFPLMDGDWIPEGYLSMEPFYLNFFENIAAVQWDHRLLAMTTLFSVLFFAWHALKQPLTEAIRSPIYLMTAMVIVQVLLGIFTLLYYVPTYLASLHQAGALILFTISLFLTHRLKLHAK
ncbi:MAG: COX15/CtaA family protein [Magnetococcales bacterium]|nr:COX15/CtaA family protein [Magnetococcales bacterium]